MLLIPVPKQPNNDTKYVIWPRWTPDGWVAFERVLRTWNGGWGWGSSGHYTYERIPPPSMINQVRDAILRVVTTEGLGKNAAKDILRVHGAGAETVIAVPPVRYHAVLQAAIAAVATAGHNRLDRCRCASPCQYPACKYRDAENVERCRIDCQAFGEW